MLSTDIRNSIFDVFYSAGDAYFIYFRPMVGFGKGNRWRPWGIDSFRLTEAGGEVRGLSESFNSTRLLTFLNSFGSTDIRLLLMSNLTSLRYVSSVKHVQLTFSRNIYCEKDDVAMCDRESYSHGIRSDFIHYTAANGQTYGQVHQKVAS